MLRFELMKIFKNKLNMTAMVLGYLLIVVCIVSYISSEEVYDSRTDSYVKGLEAFSAGRDQAESQTDYITEEYVTEFIRELQASPLDLDSDEGYIEVVRPQGSMFYLIANSYADVDAPYIVYNDIKNIDVSEGAKFYQQRLEKISDFLNMDFSFGNYTAAEKAYWMDKAEKVQEPFIWGTKEVMSLMLDLSLVGFYLLAVVVICISPVFSRESESGAGQLLFTTKYGKNRLIRAKTIASLLFSLGYVGIGLMGSVLVIGFLCGFSEANLPVQLWNISIPYNITIGQVCLLEVLVLLLITGAVTALILLISAQTKSTMATMAAILVLLIGPAFLENSKTAGWYNHLIDLCAVRFIDMKTVLGSFVDYHFGGIIVDYITMGIIVYAAVGIASLLLLRKTFVRRIMQG